MLLKKLMNCLTAFNWLRKRTALYGIASAEVFRAIFDRERARADRYSHEFSLVIFHLGNSDASDEVARHLAHVLAQRKRSTDEVGWLDQWHIGAILPDTSADKARQFAEDVARKIGNTHSTTSYRICRYPSEVLVVGTDDEGPPPQRPAADNRDNTLTQSEQFIAQDHKRTSYIPEGLLGRRIPTWKRIVDIIVSISLFLTLLPLFLLIAAFIKIVSPGPVFFKQLRVGYRGKLFTCWKFRTMRADADHSVHKDHLNKLMGSNDPMTKLDHRADPRIIPFGNLLRQAGLDELPQLFNVIRGEMSLIGPRPCLPYEADGYTLWQTGRFDTLPGITGLWQVSGKNRTTFTEMMRLDVRYAKTMSFGLDIKIFLMTFPAVFAQIGDYSGKTEGHKNANRA
jgi:lipopolysaccharide/colanic/teichoic acid biosynthesis glycosyltransferase